MKTRLRSMFAAALAVAALVFATPAAAAGKTQFMQSAVLDGWLRGLATTAAAGSTTTSVVVSSSASFRVGDFVQMASATPANAVSQVTVIPDGTHLTISPAVTTGATSGAVTRVGWSPVAVYVALFTACPTDSTAGTEVTTSGTAYARQLVTRADASWASVTAASPGVTSNANAITYAQATADFTTVNCVGIMDAVTSGNLIAWASLTAARNVTNGTTASFAIGALTWSED